MTLQKPANKHRDAPKRNNRLLKSRPITTMLKPKNSTGSKSVSARLMEKSSGTISFVILVFVLELLMKQKQSPKTLKNQELILLYAVKRNERYHYRHLLNICLILRIVAVVSVLTNFQTSCAAEHNKYDTDIS